MEIHASCSLRPLYFFSKTLHYLRTKALHFNISYRTIGHSLYYDNIIFNHVEILQISPNMPRYFAGSTRAFQLLPFFNAQNDGSIKKNKYQLKNGAFLPHVLRRVSPNPQRPRSLACVADSQCISWSARIGMPLSLASEMCLFILIVRHSSCVIIASIVDNLSPWYDRLPEKKKKTCNQNNRAR